MFLKEKKNGVLLCQKGTFVFIKTQKSQRDKISAKIFLFINFLILTLSKCWLFVLLYH